MATTLSSHEESLKDRRFSACDAYEALEDIVFLYPRSMPRGQAQAMTKTLQCAMEFLKDVISLDPTSWFRSRVVLGYTDRAKRGCDWSGRDGNRVRIPWQLLSDRNKTLDCCSHELVHPFYRISPLHKSNEPWGDCFCEFLSGPVRTVMGLDGRKWWHSKIGDRRSNKPDDGNVAGQFIVRAKREYSSLSDKETPEGFADRFLEDREKISQFVRFLFTRFSDRCMASEFYPTAKVIDRCRNIRCCTRLKV